MNKGMINIISTADGRSGNITRSALEYINTSDLVVGFDKYIDDIRDIIGNKEIYSSGMTKEVDRCKYAISKALECKRVSLISNGDANVYGMCALVLEIIEENCLWNQLDINIEPGITSLLFAASKLGAPLSSDFAVISLSDLLTPMDKIELRIRNCLMADFVICIYNPLSKSRRKPYGSFLKSLSEYRSKGFPVGVVKNIGRKSEEVVILTSDRLIEAGDENSFIDMSTVLIVGNSSSKFINNSGYILTPRGYNLAYDLKL